MAENYNRIQMGQEFESGALWENLPEDYGMIAFHRDGKLVAYSDTTNDQDILEANLSGARVAYGNNAFLLKKENGILVCRRQRRKPEPKTTKRAWW